MTVALVPATLEDFPLVKEWLDAPEIHRWLDEPFQSGDLSHAQYALLNARRGNRLFVTVAGGRKVGLVGFASWSCRHKSADVWYVLGARDMAGRGITSRAVSLAVSWAFGQEGLHTLRAWVAAPNKASVRVVEKNGFRPAGAWREAFLDADTYWDRLCFDLLRSEWASP